MAAGPVSGSVPGRGAHSAPLSGTAAVTTRGWSVMGADWPRLSLSSVWWSGGLTHLYRRTVRVDSEHLFVCTGEIGSPRVADRSAIEWTEATWNPVTGCSKVSPGCAHCYAETFAERWRGLPGHPYEQGFDLRFWPERLDQPCAGAGPRMIFVNSMSDLFHEDVPVEFVAARLRRHGRGALAHVPGPDQAPRAARRAGARAARGTPTSGWASASRTGASCTAPTTCARSRRPCASSAPSRCSGRSTASNWTASTG